MHHTHYSPLKCYMPRIYNRNAPVPIYVKDSATVMLDVEFAMRDVECAMRDVEFEMRFCTRFININLLIKISLVR